MLSALLARISEQRTDGPDKPNTFSLRQGKINFLSKALPEKGTSNYQRYLTASFPGIFLEQARRLIWKVYG